MSDNEPMPEADRQYCPIACSLDLFGDRWSLLILRDMMLNAKQRYKEFLASPEKISTNILASRLKQLVADGFIEKYPDPNDKKSAMYILSERGISLLPVVIEIVAWGAKQGLSSYVPEPLINALAQDRTSYIEAASKRLLAQRKQQLAAIKL